MADGSLDTASRVPLPRLGDSTGHAMGDDSTLEDALSATVALVVRDHGPSEADTVAQQIHTIDVCNPSCSDVQMSEHAVR